MGDAAALFREYMGTGLIVIWYMISLIYLWINEKRKYLRLLFLYMPVILLLVYFNPLFARLVYNVAEGEIYYRILWLLPITPVIAYTTVCIYGRFMDRRRADLFALCAVGMIAVSGSFIYSSPLFSKAENVWHMPDSVVHICDAIRVPGREVMALFPLELVSYVRQYDPTICMPYGREMTVDRWHNRDLLRDAMIEDGAPCQRGRMPLLHPACKPKDQRRAERVRMGNIRGDRRLYHIPGSGYRAGGSGRTAIEG